jgi:serine/threonine protein phosphatase PrpC
MRRMLLKFSGQTDVGRVREHNEDAFSVVELDERRSWIPGPDPGSVEVGAGRVLLAVSDGMGGEQAGEVASALTVAFLEAELRDERERTSGATSLVTCVQRANRAVWEASQQRGREGMGATLTAMLIHDMCAYIAEIGDSRGYLLRGSTIVQMTRDQSLVQQLVDAGTLTPEEAETSPYRNLILQAIGKSPEVNVALGRLALRRGDRFLLCSDGLSGKLRAEEMQEIVARGRDFATACAEMVALANRRGGEDNITVVLAEVTGDELPEHAEGERLSATFQNSLNDKPR